MKTSIMKVEEIPYTKAQNEQQKTTPLERCCKSQTYIKLIIMISLYCRELCVASRLSTTLDNISATAIVFPVVSLV